MADGIRPSDQNTFSIRGLDGPHHRLQVVADQHPPGSDNLGFTVVDPRASFWTRYGQMMVLQSEMQNPLATIVVHNGPRIRRVRKALALSLPYAIALIGRASGKTAEALVKSLLPALGQMALWAGGGAILGGSVGALGGPADELTIPGGAVAGFNAGLWLGGMWALKDLLIGIAGNLGRFTEFASDAVELAWYAGDDPRIPEIADLSDSAEFFAFALVELWMVILQALVLAVMRQAGKVIGKALTGPAAKAALAGVAEKLSKSKLGPGFGKWFESDFEKIQESVEEWEQEHKQEKGGETSEETSEETSGESASEPAQKKSPGPKVKSAAQTVRDWADQFPTKKTPDNGDPRNTYEIRQTGPDNTQVAGGGEKIWADGVDSANSQLQEAKYIANPAKSPYVDGSNVPDFVRQSIRDDLEDEIRRYGAVINDPNTPVNGLEIITNDPQAVPYFQSVMQKYSVPGSVVVKP